MMRPDFTPPAAGGPTGCPTPEVNRSVLRRWLAKLGLVTLFFAACGEDSRDEGSATASADRPAAEGSGASAPGDPVADPEPPDLRVGRVRYSVREDGRRESEYALAVAVPAPDGTEGSLWLASLPGRSHPDRDPAVSLYPVHGGLRGPEGTRRSAYEGSVIAEDDETGLSLILADCVAPTPPMGTGGLASAEAAWLLDVDREDWADNGDTEGVLAYEGRTVDQLRPVPARFSSADGGAFSWPQDVRMPAGQDLAPLLSREGEWAGLAVRGPDGVWALAGMPDLAGLTAARNGPFVVTGRLNEPETRLEVEFAGEMASGLRRGDFTLVLGPEEDALQGYDEEDRRYLVDLEAPARSALRTESLRFDPDSGKYRAGFTLVVEPQDEEYVLVGQMLLRHPDRPRAIPYPPFTLRFRPGPPAELEVEGNENFRAPARDLSGESESPLLGDAEVLDLPARVVRDRVVRVGHRLLLLTEGTPAVRIYDLVSGDLRPLESGLTGESLRIAADAEHAYLLDRESGVIEVWDLEERELMTAGLVEGADEVLAMAALGASPEDLLVLACRERFRFLTTDGLAERSPYLDAAGRLGSTFVSDHRLFGNDEPLRDATAMRAVQGGVVAFRGSPRFGPAGHSSAAVALGPHEEPGRLETRSVSAMASLGAFGITYFDDGMLSQPDVFPMGRQPRWSKRDRDRRDHSSPAGTFSGPEGFDPVFVVRRTAGAIPPGPPGIEVHSRDRAAAEPVSLGEFGELAGCRREFGDGGPLFASCLFPAPEFGALVTLSDDGRRLYRRDLDTAGLLERFAGGSFALLGSPPEVLSRDRPFAYRLAVAGTDDPRFELVESPAGGRVSPDGLLSWNGAAEGPEPGAENGTQFRVRVTDGDSDRSLSLVMKTELIGVGRTGATLPSGEVAKARLPLRIHEVPHGARIRDKVEVDGGRLIPLVTETPDGTFRLEVFDAEAEAWKAGADLPTEPALMCANPEVAYLLYPEREVLELRSVDDPGEIKRVPLKLPVAAMGCSPETTDGVLCVVERLTPEEVKVGEIVDWDGTRFEVSKTRGPKARFVFLSPLSLEPRSIPAREEDLTKAGFFLGARADAPPQPLAVSADGWQVAFKNYLLDLRDGEGPVKLYKHSLGFEPLWVTKDGRSLYEGGDSRYDRTDRSQAGMGVYEQTELSVKLRSWVRPLPGQAVDLECRMEDRHGTAIFRRRDDGGELLSVGPLPELSDLDFGPENLRLRGRLLSVHEDRLVSVGYGFRQLFVREFEWP